jgi:hypothetical protein
VARRVLHIAERLLQKVQEAVTEKAEARATHTHTLPPFCALPPCAARTRTYTLIADALHHPHTQRHEREAWLAKNEPKLRREQTLAALAEDREARRERAERAAAAAGKPPPEALLS